MSEDNSKDILDCRGTLYSNYGVEMTAYSDLISIATDVAFEYHTRSNTFEALSMMGGAPHWVN